MATLTSFSCVGQQIQPCSCDESSITYVRDEAQEAAEYLSTNLEQLGPRSYQEVLKRISRWTDNQGQSPDVAALGQLDEKVARAMVNMAYLQQCGNTKTQLGAEGTKTESFLQKMGFCFGFIVSVPLQVT